MMMNSSHANFSTAPATATMEDVVESCCVPPGFRFYPTEEELVGYYLARKVSSQKIDLDVIREVDLYRIEPWDLQERCMHGSQEQSEWYFFSYKDRKYPSGTRTNRATAAGFWKATGRDKPVLSKSRIIGMRKTLVFYRGRAPNGRKSDWIIHEYRLQTTETGPPQEEGWVVCRAFQKPSPSQRPCFPANYCYSSSNTTTATLHHGNSYDYGLLLESPLLMTNPNSSSDCVKSSSSNFSSDEQQQQQQQQQQQSINGSGIINVNAHHVLDVIPQMESPSLSAKEGSNSAALGGHAHDNSERIERRIMSSSNAGHRHQLIDWKVLDKLLLSSQFNESSSAPNDHNNSSKYPIVDYGGGDDHDRSQAERFLSLFDRE